MRIHVVCPHDEVTGSVESLHQFGRAAATIGYDARIAYGGDPIFGAVASEFRSYGLRNDQDVADEPDTLVLVAHTDVDAVEHLTRARKLVWWLRLDEAATDVNERALAVLDAVHLAQSEYARRYLAQHGVDATLVGDYVPRQFIARAESLIPAVKLDTVLYNSDPADQLTPALIEASRGVLQWVPVVGVSRAEVAELMAYSKVYVDFGPHAGRTRLPREAVLAGCCLLTSLQKTVGAEPGCPSQWPDGFDFDVETPDVTAQILNRIALTLMEFGAARSAFAPVRAEAAAQEYRMLADVEALLAALAGSPAGSVVAWEAAPLTDAAYAGF